MGLTADRALRELHDAAVQVWLEQVADAISDRDVDVQAVCVTVTCDSGHPVAQLRSATTSQRTLTFPGDRKTVLTCTAELGVLGEPEATCLEDLHRLVAGSFAEHRHLHRRWRAQQTWTLQTPARDIYNQIARRVGGEDRLRRLRLTALACVLTEQRQRRQLDSLTLTVHRDRAAAHISARCAGRQVNLDLDALYDLVLSWRLHAALAPEHSITVTDAGVQIRAASAASDAATSSVSDAEARRSRAAADARR